MNNSFQWALFYEALADKILQFKDKRGELFELMKRAGSEQPLMEYLHFEREDRWEPRHHQIDPFTVMGVINRGTTEANRTAWAQVLSDAFSVGLAAPVEFTGIPVLDNRRSYFSGVDEMWDLFVLAMSEASAGTFSTEFKTAFDKAIAVSGNGFAYVTMGLFWIKPNDFLPARRQFPRLRRQTLRPLGAKRNLFRRRARQLHQGLQGKSCGKIA
ncbi:MAG: hypothetical protein LBJ64_03660 [Deltaproteobacteria bacterium]|nr:hypothetical protein [Deltaproteobacteria bacterium]